MPRVTNRQMFDAMEDGVLSSLPDVLHGEHLLAADRVNEHGAVLLADIDGDEFHIGAEYFTWEMSAWESVGGSGHSGDGWLELSAGKVFDVGGGGRATESGWLCHAYGFAPRGSQAVDERGEIVARRLHDFG